ncbi:hypothetical protein H632_c3894p0, partial [Helicosporidium sp. ATCC 50920]
GGAPPGAPVLEPPGAAPRQRRGGAASGRRRGVGRVPLVLGAGGRGGKRGRGGGGAREGLFARLAVAPASHLLRPAGGAPAGRERARGGAGGGGAGRPGWEERAFEEPHPRPVRPPPLRRGSVCGRAAARQPEPRGGRLRAPRSPAQPHHARAASSSGEGGRGWGKPRESGLFRARRVGAPRSRVCQGRVYSAALPLEPPQSPGHRRGLLFLQSLLFSILLSPAPFEQSALDPGGHGGAALAAGHARLRGAAPVRAAAQLCGPARGRARAAVPRPLLRARGPLPGPGRARGGAGAAGDALAAARRPGNASPGRRARAARIPGRLGRRALRLAPGRSARRAGDGARPLDP